MNTLPHFDVWKMDMDMKPINIPKVGRDLRG